MSKLMDQARATGAARKAHEEDPAAVAVRPGTKAAPVEQAPPDLPEPYESDATGPLSRKERDLLGRCESAIETAAKAFIVGGQALEVVIKGRLWREEHDSPEEYLASRWNMSVPHAYRWINAWRLGRRLYPIGEKINEAQVRELLPLAKLYGKTHAEDAAVVVYETVVKTDGAQVTAATLHDVVAVLPDGQWDPDRTAERIRAYLAGDYSPAVPDDDPLQSLASESRRLNKGLERFAAVSVSAAAADPDAARRAISDLEATVQTIKDKLKLK